jgi:hypothetical protein
MELSRIPGRLLPKLRPRKKSGKEFCILTFDIFERTEYKVI